VTYPVYVLLLEHVLLSVIEPYGLEVRQEGAFCCQSSHFDQLILEIPSFSEKGGAYAIPGRDQKHMRVVDESYACYAVAGRLLEDNLMGSAGLHLNLAPRRSKPEISFS